MLLVGVLLFSACTKKVEETEEGIQVIVDASEVDEEDTEANEASGEVDTEVVTEIMFIEVIREDFETGAGIMTSRGGANVEIVDAIAGNGAQALYVSGRTQNWEGAQLDALGQLELNTTYKYSALVYVDSGEEVIKMTCQKTVDGTQGWDTITQVTASAGEWVYIEGEYSLAADKATEFIIYFEAENASASFYIDDFIVEQALTGGVGWLGMTSDFESEDHGWEPRMGTETLTLSSISNSGNHSIEVSNRVQTFEGIRFNLLDSMQKNDSYEIEAYVYHEDASSHELVMTMEKTESGEATYTRLGGTLVEPGVWTKITANYSYTYAGDMSGLYIYFESDDETVTFNLDDVTIKPMVVNEPKGIEEDLTSLYEVYKDHFSVGVAVPDTIISNQVMKDLVIKHFDSITAENSMKPEAMMDSENRGSINFFMSDQYNGFAKKLDTGLRGHTLVWHSQTPDWFFNENYEDDGQLASREVMLERMDAYIGAVAGRYKDSALYAWDVANEVIDTGESDNMRRSLWYETVGPDFVEQAFIMARKHTEGSDVKLFYNDYNIVSDKEKREAIFEMLKPLKEQGLVDGVGLQGHVNIESPLPEAFEDTIKLFGSIGLEVQITELDISVYSNDNERLDTVSDELLLEQAYRYKEIFDVCVDHDDIVTNITIWGLTDDRSWLNYFPVTRNNWPLLFDDMYMAKPAYYALVTPENLPPRPEKEPLPEAIEANAVRGTIKVDGIIEEQWDNAEVIQVDVYTLNSIGAQGTVKTMWDSEYLYILAEVTDTNLNSVNENPWEQDSLEIFVDENMARTRTYEDDDVQYRVNYENVVTINGGPEDSELITVTTITTDGYVVEMAIPFLLGAPEVGSAIGFDAQINDDQGSGARDSMVNWNDLTGNGWQSTEGYGTLKLVK